MDANVLVLDADNFIVSQFKCEWNLAINRYFGQRETRGRYVCIPDGKEIPFKRKTKPLKEIIRVSTDQKLDQ